MFSRRHTLLNRVLTAYKLLLGSLLLLIWVAGLGYFFVWERGEIRHTTATAASMLATQSTAALMFGDAKVLQENLASLKELDGLRWAAIVPTAIDLPLDPVRHGNAPDDLFKVLDRTGARREEMTLLDLMVRAPIVHRGVERGQVLIAVDLRGEVFGVLRLAAAALVILAIAFHLGQLLFRRIVQSIVAPLDELILATSTVANKAREDSSLDDLPRPMSDFDDEVGKLAAAFNLMLDSIVRHDRQMRDQALRLAQLVEDLRSLSARMRAVREEERTRISHEIHDELGQRLTTLKYEIARIEGGEEGRHIAGQIDDLIRTVRVISWELRPSVLDSLGLVAAIEWQAQDFARRIGVRCSVDLPEDEPVIPSEMATDLFRIFQELLTNISRYAQASRVDGILEVTDTAIHMEIKDDGRGIQARDQLRPSLGLLGIRERLERWGGMIDISAANPESDHAGTRVAIVIPLGPPTMPLDLEQMQ